LEEHHRSGGSSDEFYEGGQHYERADLGAGHSGGAGRLRSGLRKLFGRRKRDERSTEEEWYWVPEQPEAMPPPPAWNLPSPTQESLQRAEAQGFLTSPTQQPFPQNFSLPQPVPQVDFPQSTVAGPTSIQPAAPPSEAAPTLAEAIPQPEAEQPTAGFASGPEQAAEIPEWVFSDESSTEATPTSYTPPIAQPIPEIQAPAAQPIPSPAARDDGSYTIVEHNTEPIGGFLEDLDFTGDQESVDADQPPPRVGDYRYAQEPDRDTLEAVYLPAAPPEPLPGTVDAFSSVEQPAPPEPPPPPPIAVAKSTGSFDKVEPGPTQAGSEPKASISEEAGAAGKFGQKREGPPAFAAEPDVRHVVLGFRDGTAVFLEPEHPLFSLFFQWSELVAGPETPPKAYARRQAQKKIYLGKAPRGRPKKTAKKKAGG
jgi:hypothetical protein